MFHFNLESLLDHRKFIEESKQRDLALIQREFNQVQARLRDLRNNQMQLMQEFKNRLGSSIQPHELTLYRSYTARLAHEIHRQQEIMGKIEIQVNNARMELLAAMKDRKSLEIIKNKKKEDFMHRIAKKEQKLINEAALLRFDRKRS